MQNKVIYASCESYESENVEKAIDFLLSNIDGFEEKLNKAKKVLIKPNLLAPREPEKAVTTHPSVLIALINRLKPYDVEIIVGDTPAGPLNDNVIDKLYSVCGMDTVAKKTGCTLNRDFSELSVSVPDAKLSKSHKILKVAYEADVIINFAKLKTHCFTMLTCATKNQFGIVPGLLKMKYHLTLPDTDLFSNMLLDIDRYFDDKTIHFVDGVLGMEGNGPSNGTPVSAKCIIAACNSVYLDILACHVMGINPDKIQTIIEAHKRNIIKSSNFKDLDVVFNDEIKTFNFQLPPDRGSTIPSFIPKWLRDFLNNIFVPKPAVKLSDCIGCEACAETCPPQLINMIEEKAYINDYNRCIRCYCCQEVCPNNAIELINPVGRKVLGLLKLK